ncbi:MAG: DUF3347 domain-containing protein [Bacteroidota bacterium]|nr:DUF3347 domain-containing protein [Bacteroidota bacterium]
MKKITMIISAGILALTFTACNSTGSKQTNNTDSATMPSVTTTSPAIAANAKPADGILTGYINLKNSLAADNGSDAAKNGQEILDALSKFDASALTPDQKKVFLGLVGDIKENSEHISENGDKIAHQREHFEMLSKDMYDLLKATGTSKEMYLDSCPMYDNGKGTWLSEMKEIKNPYLGNKMPTCGAVKETIK